MSKLATPGYFVTLTGISAGLADIPQKYLIMNEVQICQV